jgi:hypothetical protein
MASARKLILHRFYPLRCPSSIARHWVIVTSTSPPVGKGPHLTLYVFPKAFLSKPYVQYSKPFKLWLYIAAPRSGQSSAAEMSMRCNVLAFNLRIMLRRKVRALRPNIKRKLGGAFQSHRYNWRGGPELCVSAREEVGADILIAPGALCPRANILSFLSLGQGVFLLMTCLKQDWTYVA